MPLGISVKKSPSFSLFTKQKIDPSLSPAYFPRQPARRNIHTLSFLVENQNIELEKRRRQPRASFSRLHDRLHLFLSHLFLSTTTIIHKISSSPLILDALSL